MYFQIFENKVDVNLDVETAGNAASAANIARKVGDAIMNDPWILGHPSFITMGPIGSKRI